MDPLPYKKRRINPVAVFIAIIAGFILLLLAFIFDWHIAGISLRYVTALVTGVLHIGGGFSLYRSNTQLMNKQKECIQPVEAQVIGYTSKKPWKVGSHSDPHSNRSHAPCLIYDYLGERTYNHWQYNCFTKKRMMQDYPIEKTVTLYVHPKDPDFASIKCGLSNKDKRKRRFCMICDMVYTSIVGLLIVLGAMWLIVHQMSL